MNLTCTTRRSLFLENTVGLISVLRVRDSAVVHIYIPSEGWKSGRSNIPPFGGISQLPINEDTQLKIENYLFNQYKFLSDSKDKV